MYPITPLAAAPSVSKTFKVPLIGFTKRAMDLRNVVLPIPDSPTIDTISPCSISRLSISPKIESGE